MPIVQFEDLGQMRYQDAWDSQTMLHRRMVENKLSNKQLAIGQYPQEQHLLFVEHPPVYTLGKIGSLENFLYS